MRLFSVFLWHVFFSFSLWLAGQIAEEMQSGKTRFGGFLDELGQGRAPLCSIESGLGADVVDVGGATERSEVETGKVR